jgi:hypothetical protein
MGLVLVRPLSIMSCVTMSRMYITVSMVYRRCRLCNCASLLIGLYIPYYVGECCCGEVMLFCYDTAMSCM